MREVEIGYEYKLRFTVQHRLRLESFVRALRAAAPVAHSWPAYDAEVQEDGVYFLDNGRSEASSVALRRLIDEALAQGPSVVVEEV